ncbi:MAG: pyridoxamine 5'-phosphate oxidase family protein [Flavobacteriales bacterium]
MDKKIVDYITSNKVLTIATSVNEKPYCAICFYVFDKEHNTLIFLSDYTTRHIGDALKNGFVAGTITTEVTSVAKIQGIQFNGVFVNPSKEQADGFYKIYYEKFPFARAKPSPIWGIELSAIKMTDNTLGFGKKLLWIKK